MLPLFYQLKQSGGFVLIVRRIFPNKTSASGLSLQDGLVGWIQDTEEEYSSESHKSYQAFLMQCENDKINEAEIRKALGIDKKG